MGVVACVVRSDDGHGHHVASIDHDIGADHDCPPFENNEANARFIAASRTLVPALLDRIEQLERIARETLDIADIEAARSYGVRERLDKLAAVRAELEQGK